MRIPVSLFVLCFASAAWGQSFPIPGKPVRVVFTLTVNFQLK